MHASGNHILIISLLLGEQCRGRRKSHADIDFGECDVEAEGREGVHLSCECGGGGDGADNHVAFETDGIDGDTLLNEGSDG